MGKLIGLDLFNFKSYKDHVSIKLGSANFISIIGPNGSGKSNIMDAVSFVLGVDSHYLRSSSLTQLIYRDKITEKVNEASFAYVEAEYEQADGSIIKFHRNVDHDGISSFKINDIEVSFEKYIENLKAENILVHIRNFLVFQGDVEQVASKNPRDLTDFFEQISGSINFKKEYDLLKDQYSKTANECEESIIEKRRLQMELVHYKESVIKDEKYSSKVEEKQYLWTQYYLWQLFQVDSNLDNFYDDRESIDEKVKLLQEKLALKENSLQSFKSEHVELEYNLNSKSSELKKLENEISKIKNKTLLQLNKSKSSQLKIMIDSQEKEQLLKKDLNNQDLRLQELQERLSHLEVDKLKIENTLIENSGENVKYQKLSLEDLNDINNIKAVYLNDFGGSELDKNAQLLLNSLDEKKSQLRKVNSQIIEISSLIGDLEMELEEKLNEIKLYTERNKEFERQNKQNSTMKKKYKNKIQSLNKKIDFDQIKLRNTLVRIDELSADQRETKQEQKLKENLRKLSKFFPGVKGFVIDLFRPQSAKYNQAVSLLIGRHLYSIVVDSALTATQCISYMKEQRLGIATFLPMDSISGVAPNFQLFARDAVFGTDVINCSNDYKNVLKYLSGDTIVSDTLKVAQRLKWEENYNCKIITLNGSVIQKSGIMTGGSASSSNDDVKWTKIEYQDLNYLKDELLGNIQSKKNQIKTLDDKLKTTEIAIENNALEISKNIESISYVEKAKDQILKQIQHNKKTIEDDFKVEKNTVETKIREINDRYTALCEKQDSIQQDLFKDLSEKLGFSVLEYEKTTGNFLREQKKELDLLSRDIIQIKSKISFEDQKKNNIQHSIEDVKIIINNSEEYLKNLEKDETIAKESISAKELQVKTAEVELNKYKESVKKEIKEIKTLEFEVSEAKAEKDTKTFDLFNVNSEIDTLAEQRFVLLTNCKMNAIDIPLEDNVNFADVKFESMKDVTDFVIDYKQLDKKLLSNRSKKLAEKDIDSQFQQKIATVEEELVSLHPNAHAQERYDEIQAKFDNYNQNVVVELKRKEKNILNQFNRVKAERRQAFMETYEHVEKNIDSVYKELTNDALNQNNLLGGGSATLSLEYDEENSSDESYLAGLKYQATPPFKKFKEIEYLSGGEKTVAALALLFTINSFKPSPFFILDEIDAALDSVNVLRVSNYIKKHASEDLQFIIISLKNSIYQESDSLVGVYRDQKINSSKVLTLDLSKYE